MHTKLIPSLELRAIPIKPNLDLYFTSICSLQEKDYSRTAR